MPELNGFVSAGYDNTVCVWGEEFNLIREINLKHALQVRSFVSSFVCGWGV
jgi:hypothetical protein